jgi:hypothetical protein
MLRRLKLRLGEVHACAAALAAAFLGPAADPKSAPQSPPPRSMAFGAAAGRAFAAYPPLLRRDPRLPQGAFALRLGPPSARSRLPDRRLPDRRLPDPPVCQIPGQPDGARLAQGATQAALPTAFRLRTRSQIWPPDRDKKLPPVFAPSLCPKARPAICRSCSARKAPQTGPPIEAAPRVTHLSRRLRRNWTQSNRRRSCRKRARGLRARQKRSRNDPATMGLDTALRCITGA